MMKRRILTLTEVVCILKAVAICSKISKRIETDRHTRVACPKFGHRALSSESYNYKLKTEFVAAVSMLRTE